MGAALTGFGFGRARFFCGTYYIRILFGFFHRAQGWSFSPRWRRASFGAGDDRAGRGEMAALAALGRRAETGIQDRARGESSIVIIRTLS